MSTIPTNPARQTGRVVKQFSFKCVVKCLLLPAISPNLTKGAMPSVLNTIYASHLRRGCVDDRRWALGIETKLYTRCPFSAANGEKVQEAKSVIRQHQQQCRRELSYTPKVKAKLSVQRCLQARAHLNLDSAPKGFFCDRLLGTPSPPLHRHEDYSTTLCSEWLILLIFD